MNISNWILKIPVVAVNQCRRCNSKQHINTNLKKLLLKMPRNSKHIAEAQKQRLRIKEKASRYIPGTVNLQILGSGAPGSPASVYLFTDQSRYLFNCGEGTQRLAHEHKTKLARLEHIFMTRTSWQRIGGLPGLSLTVQDAGVPKLSLHGPPGLDELYRAMRRFVILKDMSVEAVVCEAGNKFEDSVLSVTYVPFERKKAADNSNDEMQLNSNSSSRSETPCIDNTDYYAHERSANQEPTNVSPVPLSELTGDETTVMSFICQLKPRPGALSLEKCVDKGVPPGPLLGQLKNGHDIKLSDGSVVYAHEVRAPDDPGPVFCVIDIPSVEYLESLQENQCLFEKHQATAIQESEKASIVIHFTPQNVMEMPEYQSFMSKFAPTTQHLILNASNRFSGYLAAHRIQCQLNQLNEYMFPLLKESSDETHTSNKRIKLDNTEQKGTDKQMTDNGTDENEYEKMAEHNVSSLTCYHLRPNKGLDRSIEPVMNPEEFVGETLSLAGFTESLDQLKKELNRNYVSDLLLNRSDDYPKIVFLGTGSCIPNKTRNVSSILVHTSPNACILLDCGEGTSGQLIRFYGKEKYKEVLGKLKAIYISHLHADHHIGLIGILQDRRKFLGSEAEAILLLAPQQISSWLYFYDKRIESIKSEYTLIGNGDLIDEPLKDEHTEFMGLNYIRTCLVLHCPHSFGISFELNNVGGKPFKITYSGDTMPCEQLVKLGDQSDILIHEATMEDELVVQAKLKTHSTVSQAIEQGHRMNAKFTILTHFSQRYAKLPRIEMELAKNIGIAFDNMEVTPTDLRYMHLLHPTLKLLFADHCEEMEQKAIKRAYKEQRTQSRPASPVAV